MRTTACERTRVDISARLDGELDTPSSQAVELHLEGCAACRREEQRLREARRAIRIHAVEDVPDLTNSIMSRIAEQGPRLRSRSEWIVRVKVASVAAGIAALVLAGATLPHRGGQGDVASAGEISAGVSAAAGSLETYRASFDIVERGWNPQVDVRRFSAEVWFDAPERFRMLVSDFTTYPDASWQRNDVELVANPHKWWIREPSQCPEAALPVCSIGWGPATEDRTIVNRQPFDGTSDLPTDVIVPLETVVSSGELRVLGRGRVAGRDSYHVALPYREAVPLVGALQTGGSWRPFNPLDRVELWIDQRTWFPLEFKVIASRSPDRQVWADQQGLSDRPGETLLSVTAASFSTPDHFGRSTFDVPTRGIVKDGGFEGSARRLPRWAPEATYVAGLDPYRSGLAGAGQVVRSYARGMTWLKVATAKLNPPKPFYPTTAEQVRLPGSARWAYYEPASNTLPRRVDVFGKRLHAHLESNLPRDELLKVAASVGVTGSKAPNHVEASPGFSVTRIETDNPYATTSYARAPGYLPPGYRLTTSLETETKDGRSTLTTYYRSGEAEYSGFGVRITQSRPVRLLTPSSRDFLRVRVDGWAGRWSYEAGELEWIEDGTYRSVAAPSFDLSTALAIAESMR